MLKKNWKPRVAVSKSEQEKLSLLKGRKCSSTLLKILYMRGIRTDSEIARFIDKPPSDADAGRFLSELFDPFILPDMSKAIDRIFLAAQKQEKVAVYGDFDADGVTATALMIQFLRYIGLTTAIPYIPDRVDEGYGLNTPALLSLKELGVDLVLTVDCGIRSIQEVSDAVDAGLDVIVTDHHSIGETLPEDALAIVNPQRLDDEPQYHNLRSLAGVGVSFAIVFAFLKKYAKEFSLPDDFRLSNFLDLVAIGTVADVMDIGTDLNRFFVQQGLEVIRKNRRLGLKHLLEVASVKAETVTAMTIGFVIGPRINAAGRLDDAKKALTLLLSEELDEALNAAKQLNELNQQRQSLTRQSHEAIKAQLEASHELENVSLIFVQNDQIQQGIVGLVAGRLTNEYYRPSVILERGEEESRASCRSIPEFNMIEALDECADLLVRHGGHTLAAGLTVHNDNIPALKDFLLSKANRLLGNKDLQPTLKFDLLLSLAGISIPLIEELERMEPTGQGNPKPLFLSKKVYVESKSCVGSDQSHLKLNLADTKGKGSKSISAIAFGFGHMLDEIGDYIDVAYYLDINEYKGNRQPQLLIQDIQLSS